MLARSVRHSHGYVPGHASARARGCPSTTRRMANARQSSTLIFLGRTHLRQRFGSMIVLTKFLIPGSGQRRCSIAQRVALSRRRPRGGVLARSARRCPQVFRRQAHGAVLSSSRALGAVLSRSAWRCSVVERACCLGVQGRWMARCCHLISCPDAGADALAPPKYCAAAALVRERCPIGTAASLRFCVPLRPRREGAPGRRCARASGPPRRRTPGRQSERWRRCWRS